MRFHRYLIPTEFAQELSSLRAFAGQYIGDQLLDVLESTGLLRPTLRVRYPDRVARRLWLERHDEPYAMVGDLEPDGDTWDAVISLENALFRWQHAMVYGPSPHPLDSPSAEWKPFIQDPWEVPYQPWLEQRVDVSNDKYPALFDCYNVKTYYSTWQVLLAAEIATAGVHFRIDMADESKARETYQALDAREVLAAPWRIPFAPVRAIRAFREHRPVLDTVVWYAEERARAEAPILLERGAVRFVPTAEEKAHFDRAAREAANEAVRRGSVNEGAVIELARFLGERWLEWNDLGRPRIAGAYRSFLLQTIRLLELSHDRNVDWIRDAVGVVDGDGDGKPVLDVIWPDWLGGEKARVLRTLRASFSQADGARVSQAQLETFVDFLAANGLESFFWRLRSFEEHAFRGMGPRLDGMRSDLQGLAVSIEHVTRALGAKRGQLIENFKQLWGERTTVGVALKGARHLVTNSEIFPDWSSRAVAIDALRNGPGGPVVADLVWASRIRGAAHYKIEVYDQFELERLFVTLMRAAAATFAEVRRYEPGALAV